MLFKEACKKNFLLLFFIKLMVFTPFSGDQSHAAVTHDDLDVIHNNLDFFSSPRIHKIVQKSDGLMGPVEDQGFEPENNFGVIYSIGLGDLESVKARLNQQKNDEKNELKMVASDLLRANYKAVKAKLSCNLEAKERRLHKSKAFKENANQSIMALPEKTEELNIYRNIDKPIKKFTENMKMRWVHKTQVTADMIYEDLILKRYSHVIIVTHASEDGSLFDANQNEIEPSLLHRFGEHLQSLTIFSCHSDKVEDRYKWSPNSESFYKQRFFINLSRSDEIGSFAINRGNNSVLYNFLKKVDEFIYRKIDHTYITFPKRKYHKLEFLGLDSQGMAFGVKLNGELVGVISSSKNKVYIKPESLKNDKNTLILGCLNIKPFERSKLAKTEQSFEISINDKDISHLYSEIKYKHLGFADKPELYRNSRITFSMSSSS